jgi:hypothetical protein
MISRHRVSVRSRLLAAGTAMAFVVASCGGDDSSGATAESWCDFAEESDVVDDVFDSLGDDPTQVETGLKRVEEFVQQLPDEAPSEIADDVKVLADGTQMLIDAFADADYQLLDADLSFMSDSELEAQLDEAGDNIDEYTERECGRAFGANSDADAASTDGADPADTADTESTDDFDPANGTLREQLIIQFESIGLNNDEATCIADNLDFSDPAVQSGDIGAMLGVFEDCGISLERLAELGG